MMNAIGNSVAEQYERMFKMTKLAIENCSEEVWKKTELHTLVPCRLALHIIETVDFYMQEDLEGFKWGYRFNVDWEKLKRETMPDKGSMIEYLDEIQDSLLKKLRESSNKDFETELTHKYWTGKNFLDKMLYTLRHSHHHLGELNAILKRSGLTPTKWC